MSSQSPSALLERETRAELNSVDELYLAESKLAGGVGEAARGVRAELERGDRAGFFADLAELGTRAELLAGLGGRIVGFSPLSFSKRRSPACFCSFVLVSIFGGVLVSPTPAGGDLEGAGAAAAGGAAGLSADAGADEKPISIGGSESSSGLLLFGLSSGSGSALTFKSRSNSAAMARVCLDWAACRDLGLPSRERAFMDRHFPTGQRSNGMFSTHVGLYTKGLEVSIYTCVCSGLCRLQL